MPRPKRALLALTALLLLTLFAVTSLRLNASGSRPVGLYYHGPLPGTVRPGMGVAACLGREAAALAKARGYVPQPRYALDRCPHGLASVSKVVLATAGDTVRLTTGGLFVNGRREGAPPPTQDARGRPIAPLYGTRVLPAGTVWVGSEGEMGYDSRFFGPIPTAQLIATSTPVFVSARSASR